MTRMVSSIALGLLWALALNFTTNLIADSLSGMIVRAVGYRAALTIGAVLVSTLAVFSVFQLRLQSVVVFSSFLVASIAGKYFGADMFVFADPVSAYIDHYLDPIAGGATFILICVVLRHFGNKRSPPA